MSATKRINTGDYTIDTFKYDAMSVNVLNCFIVKISFVSLYANIYFALFALMNCDFLYILYIENISI